MHGSEQIALGGSHEGRRGDGEALFELAGDAHTAGIGWQDGVPIRASHPAAELVDGAQHARRVSLL